MVTKLLIIIASTAAAVSAHSHLKTDDPTRITSAAESIERRLRQGNNFLRGKKTELSSPSQTSSSAARATAASARNLSEQNVHSRSPLNQLTIDTRIIGGTPSSPERYPYLVSLTYFGSHICGGSLVAKDMVLSAAHCAGYASSVELGRYDRNMAFDENLHERIEVAYEIKHPDWNPTTVDNDFMLMKLVQLSTDENTALIKLNTDPNIPSIPGEQMTIMGWGDTNADPDVNTPSMQLLEATLEYLPDDTCRSKEGNVGTDSYIDYDSRITENMMCAMDEDGGRGDLAVDEDTCLGDSGSPMITTSNANGEEDLQVGIVSWGIGCASPTFPGVYSRVSSQYDWIRETVCSQSLSAPESFDCGESSGPNLGFPLKDESDGSKSYVTLEVSLDEQPEEFSWIVSNLSSQSSNMVATIPPGFYTGYKNYTFHHKLEVNPDQFYRFSLRDTFGDGMKGYAAVYRGSVPILSNLIMYEHYEDKTDVKKIDHAFYTGKQPPVIFSLSITFDKYPKDLWWKLESVTDSVILAQRPSGWYNDRFELMSIVETIPVFGARSTPPEYRFTIGDSYPCDDDPTKTCGDGICCNYGEGQFQLFAGAVGDGDVLASGGDYGLSESVLISPPTQSVSLQ